MSTTFTSVRELLKAKGSRDQVQEFDELMRCTEVVREMIQSRVRAGLTQKDLAKLMDVSQGTISKIENSLDHEISLGELTRYAAACEAPITLRVGPSISLVQSVKEHTISLKQDLDRLAAVASENDNSQLPKKIADVFADAGFNLMSFLVDAAEKLPKSLGEAKTPMLRVLMRDDRTMPANNTSPPSRKKSVLA